MRRDGDGVRGSCFIDDVSAGMFGLMGETATVFTCTSGSSECGARMGAEPSNRRWRPGNNGLSAFGGIASAVSEWYLIG